MAVEEDALLRYARDIKPQIEQFALSLIKETFTNPEELKLVLRQYTGEQAELLAAQLGQRILDESPYDDTWGRVNLTTPRSGGIHQGFKGVRPLSADTVSNPWGVPGVANTSGLPGWGHFFKAPSGSALPLTNRPNPSWTRPEADNYQTTWTPPPGAPSPGGYNVIKSLEFAYEDATAPFPPQPQKKEAHIVVLFCGESGGP